MSRPFLKHRSWLSQYVDDDRPVFGQCMASADSVASMWFKLTSMQVRVMAYCYVQLAVSVVPVIICSIYFACVQRDGQTELAWVAS